MGELIDEIPDDLRVLAERREEAVGGIMGGTISPDKAIVAGYDHLYGWGSVNFAAPDKGLSGVDDGSPFPLTLRTVTDIYPVGDLTEEELAQERDALGQPL